MRFTFIAEPLRQLQTIQAKIKWSMQWKHKGICKACLLENCCDKFCEKAYANGMLELNLHNMVDFFGDNTIDSSDEDAPF